MSESRHKSRVKYHFHAVPRWNQVRRSTDDPSLVFQQGSIAFAGQTLQSGSVDDMDDTPRVGDGAEPLDIARDFGHGRASHTQHLGQELLRKLYPVAFRPVGGLKQPATKTRFNRMQRIARGGDARLLEQHFVVPKAKITNFGAVVDGLTELG